MVLQKRPGYVFNGHRIPNVPRGSRSVRVKRLKRLARNVEQNDMAAFEMLVDIADDIRQKKENGMVQLEERRIRDERKSEPVFYEDEQKRSDEILLSGPPKQESVLNRVKREFPTKNEIETRMGPDLKPPDLMNSYSSVVDRKFIKTLRQKDRAFSEKEKEAESLFYSRKMSYTHQRPLNFGLKDEKSFQSSPISSDFPIYGEMDIKGEASSSGSGILGGGACMSSSTDAQKFDFDSKECRGIIRIGSFTVTVPEQPIEISETSTVGSLKRSVMSALMSLLREEWVVEVSLQGEKMRDDSKTLVQSGICHDVELSGMRITLQRNQKPQYPIGHVPLCDSLQPLNRLPPITDSSGSILTDGELVDGSSQEATYKALVPIQAANVDTLVRFTVNAKGRRSEAGQRRVRRPFSVSEVEALVHAVEKLGTGRWRDVKLRAFDDSKHRTYVDLKDKWKTLVHTAKIPPQRRRGEPVPQELLDRVLSVHSYWAEHQQPKLEACQLLC